MVSPVRRRGLEQPLPTLRIGLSGNRIAGVFVGLFVIGMVTAPLWVPSTAGDVVWRTAIAVFGAVALIVRTTLWRGIVKQSRRAVEEGAVWATPISKWAVERGGVDDIEYGATGWCGVEDGRFRIYTKSWAERGPGRGSVVAEVPVGEIVGVSSVEVLHGHAYCRVRVLTRR